VLIKLLPIPSNNSRSNLLFLYAYEVEYNKWNNFHCHINPSKTICFCARGLCVNSASSPGCQNSSSYFRSQLAPPARACDNRAACSVFSIDLDSLWYSPAGHQITMLNKRAYWLSQSLSVLVLGRVRESIPDESILLVILVGKREDSSLW
jgi:hypothetical protein